MGRRKLRLEAFMQFNWLEVFGTTASIIVAVSLTMKNIKWLRIINTIGSAFFTVYGIFIVAAPVVVLNAFIVVINIFFLIKMRTTRDRFDLIERTIQQSPYVELFLQFYKDDIARFQPDFAPKPGEDWMADLVLRDMKPVSLIVYRRLDAATLEIGLDYAVPSYRDYQSARYYFDRIAERLSGGGSLTLLQRARMPAHQAYLKRLGFEEAPEAAVSLPGHDPAVPVYRRLLAPSVG